ncbi:MAG: DUF1554 domain-containing protein, partial [Leptospiraceae bacterium]|nr:DUF1554 domain-containing protein [Leptospiraceae bacterium]
DAKCQNDGNVPSGSSSIWKAMIYLGTDSAIGRQGSDGILPSSITKNVNWVLRPNTSYVRAANSSIYLATSDWGAVLPQTLALPITTLASQAWTGMTINFGGSAACQTGSIGNFVYFTSNSGIPTGRVGITNATDNTYIQSTAEVCNTNLRLYCVEQ